MVPAVSRIDFAELGHFIQQGRIVDCDDSAAVHHDVAVNDDRMNAAAALAVDNLPRGVVERQIGRIGQVQDREVGGLADGDAADLAAETEDVGAAGCRDRERVLR